MKYIDMPFGERKYDDAAGRFLSIDPMWEKYLAWSPYHYCQNNPINAVDVNGMWTVGVHKLLVRKAFLILESEGITVSSEIQEAVIKGMVVVDKNQEDQYLHDMLLYDEKDPKQYPNISKEQAIENSIKALDFWNEQKQDLFDNKSDWEALGELLHPLSDADCPSHKNWQVWYPQVIGSQAAHVLGDFKFLNPDEFNTSLEVVTNKLRTSIIEKKNEVPKKD